ncbi:glucose-1-phosphate adenylyltransferase GlgC [Thermoclostridium stercorarium subsp. stercorarium DSM 8532]|jgi:glucose-1-phosphate adenylyltransferase|uniref:Glucose-1-phosphate adenylyltransferase n=3 Tax=Thermoclostridium stercorarium TaxID=1510 RepID=L7VRM0_THES1|nr:glucose-1-phosphate adenylyltransferase [Thermoclostridium stercorarium]AGC69026.1 glucose-1-phosphate adenylyltransferase GlgC [Thermoclostridium stercorarium subsp. stercorarium DSM 8532]AGI40000.1 glucose-1-phosphate adenylyltransferase [Thermoclostridium stercorarium subsp. stercorarium DSM 8532]ANW99319.1 glucose-1-phosphate adenylyltransferase [Thermoclostridium stercorarium subsp. thermolacticum DSM 2910]ANX01948.1 glucose-1-phosphate adenylyltransferase [Thermoclostridium stercorariu
MRKEIIALILAGGQGSRLGILTKLTAKPAVMYGGKYRIIDFSLSNCINSGIDTVGVLTQYRPLQLTHHIGIGKPWDLDRLNGGVTILSPFTKQLKGEWYSGTADAVYQNMHYIEEQNPKYVIILSGDHVYKMNYSMMLDFHKKNNADVTISAIQVPIEEAHRYGVILATDEGKIYGFEEKPKEPKSNLVSMGVYIFNLNVLKESLIEDHHDNNSGHDFGKNVIPKLLKTGKRLWAYTFSGYWRDVGTIQSYYESNMDLVTRVPEFNLFDPNWRIYTPNPVKPAHYIGPKGYVIRSIVAEGCMIYGTVINSVIFPGVTIEENACVENCIIMSNSTVKQGSYLNCTIIGEKTVIGTGVKTGIGEYAENIFNSKIYNSKITVIGSDAVIPDNVTIGCNVVIDNQIMPGDFPFTYIPSGYALLKGDGGHV